MDNLSPGKRSKRAESSVHSSPLIKNKRQMKIEKKKEEISSPDSKVSMQ